MHAGHDDVERGEQLLVLVEGAVEEDVDLDPGQDPEGGQLGVQGAHHVELLAEPLRREALGDVEGP